MSQQENNNIFVVAIVATAALVGVLLFGGRQNSVTVPVVAPPPVPAKSDPDNDAGSGGAEQKTMQSVPERVALDETLWAPEVLAQKHEEVFIGLWDNLRKSPAPLSVLRQFPLQQITFQKLGEIKSLGHGITERVMSGAKETWNSDQFAKWIADMENAGLRLVQSEWHHSKFEPVEDGPNRSLFSAGIDLANGDRRYSTSFKFTVQWLAQADPKSAPKVDHVEITELNLKERQGKPAYEKVDLPISKPIRALPMLVYDLDLDGLSEIILPHAALILRNRGGMVFESETLDGYPPRIGSAELVENAKDSAVAAVVADFSQDGRPDLAIALRKLGVFIYEQLPDGKFGNPRHVFRDAENIIKPYVMTTGDFNQDGLLDIWFGQYKEPYRMGQMPDPMFDANDGFPAYLLANRGNWKFEDVTESAGLGGKRNRRTFSGSFWDSDDDGDLDLIVVSDFSGVDLYENDGTGKFTDTTTKAIDERANFGMGHTFADFNGDGHMDFYVTGMSSTTARRLESLGLKREGFPEINDHRMAMAYGNRMYLSDGKGNYRQPSFKDLVARTGWAWGTSHFDFGNDGLLDIYVANGNRSGETCKDYCTRFWTHDVYMDKSLPMSTTMNAIKTELNEWAHTSWNGYEKNRLLINGGKNQYFNGGFTLDVGFEYDTRSVVTEDLDGDGRVDLLLSQDSAQGINFQMHLYRNVWGENGNWIGIRLRSGKRLSESGARIIVETAERTLHELLVNGDSLACQHPSGRHFGLGTAAKVKSVTVKWPGGEITKLDAPPINRWHTIKAPK